jgi:hypothetical protein
MVAEDTGRVDGVDGSGRNSKAVRRAWPSPWGEDPIGTVAAVCYFGGINISLAYFAQKANRIKWKNKNF